MNWEDVESYLKRDDRIILPIGSTEQHGPIGIFGTDHVIPDAMARAVAERLGVVVAPPYASSPASEVSSEGIVYDSLREFLTNRALVARHNPSPEDIEELKGIRLRSYKPTVEFWIGVLERMRLDRREIE